MPEASFSPNVSRKLPTSTRLAIRHIGTVEVNVTPVLEIFCMPADGEHTFRDLHKNYRRLCLLVHPDRVQRMNEGGSPRYMQLVSRAFEQARYEARAALLLNEDVDDMQNAIIPWSLKFSRIATRNEVFVDQFDHHEAKRQEEKEQRREDERRREQEAAEERADRERAKHLQCAVWRNIIQSEEPIQDRDSSCSDVPVKDGNSQVGLNSNDTPPAVREGTPPRAGDMGPCPDNDSEGIQREEVARGNVVDDTKGLEADLLVRRRQQRDFKRKLKDRSRSALKLEAEQAESWKPRSCVAVQPEVHMQFGARWQCEQYIRAYTAHHGTRNGININVNNTAVTTKCRTKGCAASFKFSWQSKTGLWKLNRFVEHLDECSEQFMKEDGSGGSTRYCRAAYTARQVARAIVDDVEIELGISTSVVTALVKAKALYSSQPNPTHYRNVRIELQKMLAISTAVEMAALEGYAELLRKSGHVVQFITVTGQEMKRIRMNAAKHIFEMWKERQTISDNAVFDERIVELADIQDSGNYYGGFILTPSTAEHTCANAQMTCAAKATSWDGELSQFYGTTFEVVAYDAKNEVMPLVFGYSVGPECYESWKLVFDACAELGRFDVLDRTTIVDQENYIDEAYRKCFKNARKFFDPVHVKKKLGPKLGPSKAIGLDLYDQAVHAPTMAALEGMKRQFPPAMQEHLSTYEDSELYRTARSLSDFRRTARGAESRDSANIRSTMRACKPQKMISHVLLSQRTGFLKQQSESLGSDDLTWKLQYRNVMFPLPEQDAVDQVIMNAKKIVALGADVQVPKGLPPPRGLSVKFTGKRKKGSCILSEPCATTEEKRSKSCSPEPCANTEQVRRYCTLCHCHGHIRQDCNLKHLFE